MVMKGGRWVIGAAIVLVILVVTPVSEAAISCGGVVSALAPCFDYVLRGGKVPSNCCSGVTSLYKQAGTRADRQTVCSCLKSVTGSASNAAVSNAASLPKKCGVNIPYKITPAIDCAKVR